jgi:hypothetical protein
LGAPLPRRVHAQSRDALDGLGRIPSGAAARIAICHVTVHAEDDAK